MARRPVVVAAITYLIVATGALWPSIRPGHTLVPADVLVIESPYSAVPAAGEPDNLLLSDAAFQFFPWFHYLAEGMRHGEIRQWNPYLLGGMPVTPNGNISPYYPPTWLGAVMSPFDAYDLFVVLHLVIGALGVYVLGRALGIRPLASWIGGLLAFAAAFWVHWSTHLVHIAGMVWCPWVLAATWWLLVAPSSSPARHPTRRRVAALAGAMAMWLLGGSPQYVYFGALALLGWTLAILAVSRLRDRGPLLRPAAGFGLAVGLAVLLAAPVLLPTLAASSRVARARETEAPTDHVPKREAIRALVPDATGNPADSVLYGSNDELRMDSPFIGVTGMLLVGAATGGVRWRRRRHPPDGEAAPRREVGRGVLLAGTAVILILGYTGLPHRVLFELVPGYDRFRASPRWLFLLPVFALPLAALGLQDLLRGARRTQVALLATAGVSVVVLAGWFAYERSQPGAPVTYLQHRVLLAGAVVVAVAAIGCLAGSRPRLAVAGMALVVLGEVAFHTPRWYPRVDQATAYPDTVVSDLAAGRGGRFITVGPRTPFPPFGPDVSMIFGAADAHGLSVLFPKDYDRYLRLIEDYGIYAEEFNLAPPLGSGDLLASPLLDALDVRTVLAEGPVAIGVEYPLLVTDASQLRVYGRPTPGGAVVVATASPATEDQMWARVADPTWRPVATSAVPGLDHTVSGAGGTAVARPAPADREVWEVDAHAGGFLRVGSRWDPGWTATVDGKPAPVLRADGIFRGVVVAPGRHVVRFSYQNPEEMRGRLVGLGALVVFAVLLTPLPGKFRRRVNPMVPENV